MCFSNFKICNVRMYVCPTTPRLHWLSFRSFQPKHHHFIISDQKKIIHLFFGHVDIQIPNHHWFKRLSYFYFMFLVLWEKKIWLTHAFISILYILSHWSMRLFLCQYCIVLCNLFLLWTFFIIKCCYIIPLMLPFFFSELTRDLVTFVFAYESHEFEYFFLLVLWRNVIRILMEITWVLNINFGNMTILPILIKFQHIWEVFLSCSF